MDLKGRTVAITGAASGFGMEMARNCFKKGAKLALADIDAPGLAAVEKELKDKGAEVFSMVFDVAQYDKMEEFAQKTFDTYGDVGLFFNNAGVEISGTIWEMSMADWHWVYGVNVFGIIHGIKCFTPRMIAQDKEAIIINTASLAGLIQGSTSPIYISVKHAVVSMTESLDLSLRENNAKVKAFVFTPGFVKTQLHTSARNRPAALQNPPDAPYYQSEDYKQKQGLSAFSVVNGIELDKSIEMVFDAIEQDKFYIHTAPEMKPAIELRCKNVVENNRPMGILKK